MKRSIRGWSLVTAATLAVVATGSPGAQHDASTAGPVTLVSIAQGGTVADGFSGGGKMSGDGRFVAFYSEATNLAPGDDNDAGDVFLRDVAEGKTELISIASDGSQGDRPSSYPIGVSDDGRYVLFGSAATNLDDEEADTEFALYMRDRDAGETWRVSVDEAGDVLPRSYSGVMSADGGFVAFATYEAGEDGGSWPDRVFLHDVVASESRLVAAFPNALDGNQLRPGSPVLSGDGRYLAFASDDGPEAGYDGVMRTFVYDRESDEIAAIPVPESGAVDTQVVPTDFSYDGRWLLVIAESLDSEGGVPVVSAAPYLYDLDTGTYVSVPVPGRVPPLDVHPNPVHSALLSADGRYVAYLAFIEQYDPFFGGTIEVQGTVVFDRIEGSLSQPLTTYVGHDLVRVSFPLTCPRTATSFSLVRDRIGSIQSMATVWTTRSCFAAAWAKCSSSTGWLYRTSATDRDRRHPDVRRPPTTWKKGKAPGIWWRCRGPMEGGGKRLRFVSGCLGTKRLF